MRFLYCFLMILLLGACVADPAPDGPTTEQPIFFNAPDHNGLVSAWGATRVKFSLSADYEYASVELLADGRPVRIEELSEGNWQHAQIDDGLVTFDVGEHVLEVRATTLEGEVYTRTVTVFSRKQYVANPDSFDDLRITRIEVVNVLSGEHYADFDPAVMELVPEVPVEDVQNQRAKFIFHFNADVSSAKVSGYLDDDFYYGLNGIEALLKDKASSDIVGDWYLFVRPEVLLDGEYIRSPEFDVPFKIVDSRLSVKTRSILLEGSIGSGESPQAELVIDNIGGFKGDYIFKEVPEWLVLDRYAGTVEADDSVVIGVTTESCTATLAEEAVITVTVNGDDADITVRRECIEGSLFDLSLDRFYFNQSIPANDSRADVDTARVELVAGRKGIARTFVTGHHMQSDVLPLVQLHYRTGEGIEGVYELSGPLSVPQSIFEGRLEQTFNVDLPEAFFKPGTEFYVTVDPDNAIDERLEDNNRYPSEGYLPLRIRSVPTLKVTFVPMVKSGSVLSSNVNPDNIPSLMQRAMAFMPLANYEVSIREQPYTYTSISWSGASSELKALRQADNAQGHYYGVLQEKVNESAAGRGEIFGFVALSLPTPELIAHELGHNFGLRHAPCGSVAFPDESYPYENADINTWGYNIFSGFLKKPTSKDFMGYCPSKWISPYHYRNIMIRRGGESFPVVNQSSLQKASLYSPEVEQELLVISGMIKSGQPKVERVYRTVGVIEETMASAYLLKLYDADGAEIYASRLSVGDISHTTEQTFSVRIPAWEFGDDVAKLRIEKGGVAYVDEQWLIGESLVSDLTVGIKVERLDSERVRIEWPEREQASLWVRDVATNNILAVDGTGKVEVFTRSSQLELKVTRYGREVVTVIEVD